MASRAAWALAPRGFPCQFSSSSISGNPRPGEEGGKEEGSQREGRMEGGRQRGSLVPRSERGMRNGPPPLGPGNEASTEETRVQL